ncbi:SAF domain-containing protein [Georgenia yuyongxinii]|uniref:SAF domain-containing protein n=1 Tax=Georgenia yuyongxinii TaxID=2589797 RepID=UPI00163D87A4|nr:SAF domain-containing protein [Georgenia yuyongxinii]
MAVVAVAVGGILGAATWSSMSTSTSVLVAKDTLHRGDEITADDFTVTKLNVDAALDPVPVEELQAIAGQRLSLDIAKGAIFTRAAAAPFSTTREGMTLVGIAVTGGQAPGTPLLVGDRVRVVVTPGPSGEVEGVPDTTSAEVAGVTPGSQPGSVVVDLLVPAANAAVLAAQAATGNVAVVLENRER